MDSQLLGVLLGALLTSVVYFLTGFRKRRFESKESVARSDLTLNVTVQPRVITCEGKNEEDSTFILETRVRARNNSRVPCCIPGVYVSARALIERGIEGHYLGHFDFDNLPTCGTLSESRNVAQIPNTIIQLAPDEEEEFVRWDTLDSDFVSRYPVVVVNVELFGASAEQLGETHLQGAEPGELRHAWIDFFGRRVKGIDAIPFARWPIQSQPRSDCVRPGKRYILSSIESGQPDIERTRQFREVLDTITQWSRHVTVDLRANR